MCTATVAQEILDVLVESVSNQEVFTAFDITKKARQKTADTVLHNDVRRIVNSEFVNVQLDGYLRELRTLDVSNSSQAFVYFPANKSSSDHPLVVEDTTPIDDDNDDTDDTDDDTDDDESEIVSITADCRIDIPRKMLTKVDAPAGSYNIMINNNVKYCLPAKDGRVRIGLKRLGGFTIYDKCSVAADSKTNTITVKFV